MNEILHIAFCVSDSYVTYILVTIKSIIANHPSQKVDIHVLCDRLSQKSIEQLNRAIGDEADHVHIHIHYIDDDKINGLELGKWTKYAWYRIFLPEILPDVNRILYLDADTLVTDNLGYLFELDMTNKSLAGALDCENFDDKIYAARKVEKGEGYFCSGVLLFNLDYWRKHNLTDKAINFAKKRGKELLYPDQDTINTICNGTKLVLPLKYQVTVTLFYRKAHYANHFEEVKDAFYNPAIIHYTNWLLPWYEGCNHPLLHYWTTFNNLLSKEDRVKKKLVPSGLTYIKNRIWHLFNHPSRDNYNKIKSFIDNYEYFFISEQQI